jgi:hypothetical protein
MYSDHARGRLASPRHRCAAVIGILAAAVPAAAVTVALAAPAVAGPAPGTSAATPAWVTQPVPAPVVHHGQLWAISCTSATSCTAVGWYADSAGKMVPLAEAGTALPGPSRPSLVAASAAC